MLCIDVNICHYLLPLKCMYIYMCFTSSLKSELLQQTSACCIIIRRIRVETRENRSMFKPGKLDKNFMLYKSR